MAGVGERGTGARARGGWRGRRQDGVRGDLASDIYGYGFGGGGGMCGSLLAGTADRGRVDLDFCAGRALDASFRGARERGWWDRDMRVVQLCSGRTRGAGASWAD